MYQLSFTGRQGKTCVLLQLAIFSVWTGTVWAQPFGFNIEDVILHRDSMQDVMKGPEPIVLICDGLHFELKSLPDSLVDGKCCYELILANTKDEELKILGYLELVFQDTGFMGTASEDFILFDDLDELLLYEHTNEDGSGIDLPAKGRLTVGKVCMDADLSGKIGLGFGPFTAGCRIFVEVPKCEDTCCAQFEVQFRNFRRCPDAPCQVDIYFQYHGGGTAEGGGPCARVESILIDSTGEIISGYIPPNTSTLIAPNFNFALSGQSTITIQVRLEDGRTCDIVVYNPCLL